MGKYNVLQDRLTEKFIRYQWRLENPIPSVNETDILMDGRYRTNPIFRAKVNSLVAGIIDTVIQWENEMLENVGG